MSPKRTVADEFSSYLRVFAANAQMEHLFVGCCEKDIENNELLFGQLITLTRNPCYSSVQNALVQTWKLTDMAAAGVTNAIKKSMQFLRKRASNCKDGSRQISAVKRLLAVWKASMEHSPEASKFVRADSSAAVAPATPPRRPCPLKFATTSPSCSSNQTSEVLDVTSSPEALEQQPAGVYWCQAESCIVRAFVDGTVEKAIMSDGPSGFLLAQWPNGKTETTEVPNLVLHVPESHQPPLSKADKKKAKAKAKATMKRPAASLKKPPVKELYSEDEEAKASLNKKKRPAKVETCSEDDQEVAADECNSADENAHSDDDVEDLELDAPAQQHGIAPVVYDSEEKPEKPRPVNIKNYTLRFTSGTEQSYITHQKIGQDKKPLLISVSRVMAERKGKDHFLLCLEIWNSMVAGRVSITTSAASEARRSLLE